MRMTNTLETYGLVHQILHWATAALILFLLPLGIYMHQLPATTGAEVADKVWLYSLHKTVGVAALVVALIRVAWAAAQPHPNLLHGGMEAFGAKTVHWLLYGAIIAMPVFGWIHHAALEGYAPIWWGNILPGDWNSLPFVPKSQAVAGFFGLAHKITGFALIAALVAHIGGAIKHAVIDKDETLARMVPGAYGETGLPPTPKGYGASSRATAALLAVLGMGVIAGVWTFSQPHSPAARSTTNAAQAPQAAATSPAPVVSDNPAHAGQPAGEMVGNWVIDHENSTLAIEVQQMAAPVTGAFSTWSADVAFDPEALDTASIAAAVDTTSLSLGDVSDRAKSAEFLNAEAYPTASFVSDTVKKTPEGYLATGTLTLAGVEQPFELPFTFSESDGVAQVTARAAIKRLDHNIGTGFADDSTVGRVVDVIITIKAQRADMSQ